MTQQDGMPMQHLQSECYICCEPCEVRTICACRGTTGAVHVHCLVLSIASSWTSAARDHRVWTSCRVCKTEYANSVRLPLAKAFWKLADRFWVIYALLTMGEALEAIGLLREAVPWMAQALELRRSLWGMQESHTLRAASALARVQFGLGNVEMSIKLQRDVLRWRREHLGQADVGTGSSMGRLAHALCVVGGLAEKKEAVELHLQARNLMKQVVVDKHRLDIGLTLAKGFISLGFYEEADAEFRELCPKLQQILGHQHPKVLGAQAAARRCVGLLFIYGGTNSMDCLTDLNDRLKLSQGSPIAPSSEAKGLSVGRDCSQPLEVLRCFLIYTYRLISSLFVSLYK
eukprot:TRINITY_DN4563_c0_g1_i1.p1 TRINITY_DN4563_c0_g1~~TRINITY_DN4563_c0_g1_i1.p1  ORF type:complete len:345 (-),score=50.40 TRINITY_DN4563_c0_g1_i1:111-1145(-)